MDLVTLCHPANAPPATRLSILRNPADRQRFPIEVVKEWTLCWRVDPERVDFDPREKLDDASRRNSSRESPLRRQPSSAPKMNWPALTKGRPTLWSVMHHRPIEHLCDIGVSEHLPRRLSTSQLTNNRAHLFPAFFFHE